MRLTDVSEIRALMDRHGFHFSKSLGQNFLSAQWVPERIVDCAQLDAGSGVLEVGPGVGCLTAELSKRAGKVLCVELDKSLRPVLAETLADCGNVELIFGDILRQNIPALVEEHFQGLRPSVCANLPYNVTTPLLTAFIEADCFESVTVLMQREVAKRLCAAAGSEDYGAFTLFVQWHMQAEPLFDVPPGCFVPQPKVTSTVLRLTRRTEKPLPVDDEALMFRVIRAAFNQRRKTLLNALSSGIRELDKHQLEEILVNCGLDTRIRGETLDIGSYAKISDEIGKKIGQI